MLNDIELINKTLSGDLFAYDELMKRYERLVYRVCYGFGKNREDTLDITQNVFLKVYLKLSTFKNKSIFKSWLVKVSYNEGINWTRKNQKFKNDDAVEDENDYPALSISTEDELVEKEKNSNLINILNRLNARHRLAVVLRYFEGMHIKEIAATMKCTEGLVKNMLFRSLKKMRDQLNFQNQQKLVG